MIWIPITDSEYYLLVQLSILLDRTIWSSTFEQARLWKLLG